ncbi:hypothetical protein [Dishui Lake phycodnavirus 3]|nr:hypothetical protein [Dishui Lake phycodnavirus 3]
MFCCFRPKQCHEPSECTHVYRVSTLVKVVDGDTVDVIIDLGFSVFTQQRVRLLGIDTPESRTVDVEEKKYGLLAKKKLSDLCAKATRIELRCPKRDSREKFGRVLGELWVFDNVEWINANRWLCENGYAVPYTGDNKKDVHALHLENREKLRARGDGPSTHP